MRLMRHDGERCPVLTCATFLRDYLPGPIRVEPLANFPVERDLVIVLDDFMEKLPTIKPWIIRETRAAVRSGRVPADACAARRLQAVQHVHQLHAVLRGVPGLPERRGVSRPSGTGPGSALQPRLARRGQATERNELVWLDDGVWDCTFVGECSAVCPKGVDPAGAIQQAKLESTLGWYRSFLMPFGRK